MPLPPIGDGKAGNGGTSQKTCQVRSFEKAFEEKAFNAPALKKALPHCHFV
jgi:hypothetical protein